MGHVGRGNIYATWPFVKCCLLLSYMGQGAWLINNAGDPELMGIADLNPFYQMLAPGLRPFAVGLSTVAAIIASQALITGAFSLVSEASRLDLMPHMQVFYPAETKGQLYIPMVNNVMLVGCVVVVLLFQNSAHMEAAYGLAITLTMMCTTMLLFFYLHVERNLKVAPWIFAAFFLLLEGFFFVSSLTKFFHGGYFTILMAALIMGIMVCWYNGTAVEQRQFTLLPLRSYLPQLKRLRDDDRYELMSDNIVYLTKDTNTDYIDRDIVYSILDKHPKRARAWWFVNVETMDEPHTFAYSVETFGTDYVFRVHLYLATRLTNASTPTCAKLFRTWLPPASCRRRRTTTRSIKIRQHWHVQIRHDPQAAGARKRRGAERAHGHHAQVHHPPRRRHARALVRPGELQREL